MDYDLDQDRDRDRDHRERSRYSSRDHHDRDYYDRRDSYDFDRDLDYPGSFRGGPPPPGGPPGPMDDPYRSRPLLPHPPPPPPGPPIPPIPEDGPFKEPIPEGAVVMGRVVLFPSNPLDPRPKLRPRPSACKTVFVGSLPDICEDRHLMDLFQGCGSITEVRVSRGRNFGHVQFAGEGAVDQAIKLSGCLIKIHNMSFPNACSRIHVDFAQDKEDFGLKRRLKGNEMLPFNKKNAATISSDLHRDDVYHFAAKNVSHWITNGSCDAGSSTLLFELVTSINARGRKLIKSIQDKEEEELEYRVKKQAYYKKLADECKVTLEVYESAAGNAKTWNMFTKGQRKSITQWKEQTLDIQERLRLKLSGAGADDSTDETAGPPTKVAKLESNDESEARLERALKEIEQLKVDREVAVDKRDKQILQLKTLLAKFKKTCPEEWEKALGVPDSKKNGAEKDQEEGAEDVVVVDALDQSSEVIDGVSLDDLNAAMSKEASENSLASAAAAYAQMRKTVGSSSDMSGLGLSEAEVAIVAVLAAFLTVHPLGATIETITSYFQTFNPAYNSYYLESLLHRLTKVFQLSKEGGSKWWFLGFQTCYATPTTASSSTSRAGAKTSDIKTEQMSS